MKAKIEEKIENAREATNEMFAAVDELNEKLSERICEIRLPKIGEFLYVEDMPKIESRGDMKFATLNADTIKSYFGVQAPEVIKPKFKKGDWFIPHKPKENKTNVFWVKEMDEFDGVALQVSEPKFKNAEGIYSEVADWHFHPDWCEKTTAPKHKEPIIGEMAIFWDTDNKKAFCATLNSMINGRYSPDGNIRFDNAILFESPEQYKAFLKS
jgi:hypothetical protein